MTQQGAASGWDAPARWSMPGTLPHQRPPLAGLPPRAAWSRRVVAALLDNALLGGVTWLAFPVQPVDPPQLTPFFSGPTTTTTVLSAVGQPVSWTSSGWVVAALAAALVLRAYLGASPGQLVLGIAVVREVDARPAGLARTLLRWAAHLLDAILLVGYLRPLWDPRGQTLADSIAGTVVLTTRRPLPHPWLARRSPPAQAGTGQAAVTPPWRWAATALAVPACLFGAAVGLGMSESSGAWSTGCAPSGSESSGVLADAIVTWTPPFDSTSRAGITRSVPVDGAGLAIGPLATVPEAGSLRATLTAPDGTRREAESTWSADNPARGTVLLDAAEVGTLEPGTALRLVLQDADGAVVGTCDVGSY
ncbi:RDD family protein [Actinotalea sp.]|uniref:RDD family protein n=1 Tax=Actinotalea sp. TaxID=1872145 RepID=UPI002CDA4164|nr:RDD family protein [Actinotalea sp.]HQY34377.1 RDD family protein [Actinotalea sp.]HRA50300.1 RDD family protein [Actinotalea sp.]